MMKSLRVVLIIIVVVVLLAIPLVRSMFFTVDERELAVVLQFGQPVASYAEPGLKFKLPLVQTVRRLPKTYQFWSGEGGEILVDVPTADGKKVEVTPWVIWRITDPVQFIEELVTVERAEERVKEFVRGEMRDAITSNVLAEVVRSTNRELTYTFQVETLFEIDERNSQENPLPALRQPGAEKQIELGRQKLVEQIKSAVQRQLGYTEDGQKAGRGIELVDVGIAKIDFVDVVREAAFERLKAFMEAIAARYVNEGERRKKEILNRTQAEVDQIQGEGKGQAAKIRGEAEAKVIQMYADAIRQMGEFYRFLRTLELYRNSVGPNTRLVLTTDSELFKMLKSGVNQPKNSPNSQQAAPTDGGPPTSNK